MVDFCENVPLNVTSGLVLASKTVYDRGEVIWTVLPRNIDTGRCEWRVVPVGGSGGGASASDKLKKQTKTKKSIVNSLNPTKNNLQSSRAIGKADLALSDKFFVIFKRDEASDNRIGRSHVFLILALIVLILLLVTWIIVDSGCCEATHINQKKKTKTRMIIKTWLLAYKKHAKELELPTPVPFSPIVKTSSSERVVISD